MAKRVRDGNCVDGPVKDFPFPGGVWTHEDCFAIFPFLISPSFPLSLFKLSSYDPSLSFQQKYIYFRIDSLRQSLLQSGTCNVQRSHFVLALIDEKTMIDLVIRCRLCLVWLPWDFDSLFATARFSLFSQTPAAAFRLRVCCCWYM